MREIAAMAAIAWLVSALLVMARSIRRGRALADALASRHPEAYEALGRPYPGYLASERGRRFARLVARRGYAALDDPALAAEFDAYRRAEARLVVSILVSMVAVFVVMLVVRFTT